LSVALTTTKCDSIRCNGEDCPLYQTPAIYFDGRYVTYGIEQKWKRTELQILPVLSSFSKNSRIQEKHLNELRNLPGTIQI